MGFLETKTKDSLNVLFFNRLYPIQCSLLDGCIGLPASCHLTTRLSAAHSQPYNSGESISCFYLLVPPFSPTGYKSMPQERLQIYCGDIIRTKEIFFAYSFQCSSDKVFTPLFCNIVYFLLYF